ncbi:MAG: acyltransferase [Cyclobacteriaceae bacterium]|nr:acyltransferase [Cyclobacteriaceae bacterium]
MLHIPLIKSRLKLLKEKNPNLSNLEIFNIILVGAWRVLLAKIYLRSCNQIGKVVSVNGKPIIGNLGEMYIDDEVRIWSIISRAQLYTGENGKLVVGKESSLNGVHIDARELVEIGERVRIAPYTIIMDSDFHDLKDHNKEGPSSPIYIEDDVWIATRATILKGVRIGKGSVIATGAIVTKDVPPYCVAAGTPARVVKKIEM